MNKIILLAAALLLADAAAAQETGKDAKEKNAAVKKNPCDSMVVDFEKGLINGKIGPNSPADSINKYLPCTTSEVPFGSDIHICGGGNWFEKHGIYFNLEHGFIEFSGTTKAILPVQCIGVSEDSLSFLLDEPAQITDLQPYSDRAIQSVYLYPKSYGCLAVWVDQKDKKAFKVQLHNAAPAKAFLCIE